jgi:hypothetical protein
LVRGVGFRGAQNARRLGSATNAVGYQRHAMKTLAGLTIIISRSAVQARILPADQLG